MDGDGDADAAAAAASASSATDATRRPLRPMAGAAGGRTRCACSPVCITGGVGSSAAASALSASRPPATGGGVPASAGLRADIPLRAERHAEGGTQCCQHDDSGCWVSH